LAMELVEGEDLSERISRGPAGRQVGGWGRGNENDFLSEFSRDLVGISPIRKGRSMKRKSLLSLGVAAVALAALGGGAYGQGQFDKYTLKSPGGIAFSDFRGYESWEMVSSARTDTELKVMLANPVMINAYKAGIPGNGQTFPEGSKIVKLQ